MKTNEHPEGSNPSLSESDLDAMFASAPVLDHSELEKLEQASEALEKDPKFLADYTKGLLVEDILRGMEVNGLNQKTLAEKLGKSRQYVNKILKEERRANFTVDTLAELSTALDLKLSMRLLPPGEAIIAKRSISITLSQSEAFSPSYRDKPDIGADSFIPDNKIIQFPTTNSDEPTSMPA